MVLLLYRLLSPKMLKGGGGFESSTVKWLSHLQVGETNKARRSVSPDREQRERARGRTSAWRYIPPPAAHISPGRAQSTNGRGRGTKKTLARSTRGAPRLEGRRGAKEKMGPWLGDHHLSLPEVSQELGRSQATTGRSLARQTAARYQ